MILIIDNYIENGRVQQIVEAVQQCTNVPIDVVSFRLVKEIDSSEISCLILSGSTCNLSNKEDEKKYTDEIEFVKACQVSVLGICFGHHILGRACGSEILRGKWTKKTEKVEILTRNELFSSWDTGDEITVKESHGDYIEKLPREFIKLASSESCKIEAMKHCTKPLYGVQFHAERTEDGRQVINNFIRNVANLCRKNELMGYGRF